MLSIKRKRILAMPEVMFVIKSLVVTVIIVLCLQVKVGHATAEDHVNDWMRTSAVTEYLREVAQGAALAIHNTAGIVSNFASEKFGGGVETIKQKAGR